MIATIDWIIIVLYVAVVLFIGYYFSRKKDINTGDFFVGGRKLPWYIAGTSMVAITFAADTPLAVTELVAEHGIAGNWLWWNMVFGGVLTVFFFARLWRRANIYTDCEFVTLRYSGKEAHFLRGFRALYIGLFMNILVISWVNLAMVKILTVMFPEVSFLGITNFSFIGLEFTSHHLMVICIMLFIALYSSMGGLSGVSFVDTFQFFLSMSGCILLAVFALNHPAIGGIGGLKEKLPDFAFNFFPSIGETSSNGSMGGLISMGWVAFLVFFGMQWWVSWYPGAEPGGGGYIAQRMMAAKNEKHAMGATLWFQIAHYAIRPWPWIIVALVSIVMYPELLAHQKGDGFVLVIRDVLPSGLLGLLLAAFLAAYMSTVASQIVWGSSYIINDFVKPYIHTEKSEKYYVNISRLSTILLLIVSIFVTTKLDKISDVWKFMLEYSGGIGLVLILRWFWWRINAWSEISALIAPFFMYPVLKYFEIDFPHSLPIIVLWSTLVWVSVTFLTKPSDNKTLENFYSLIHPSALGWKPVAKKLPNITPDKGYLSLFIAWACGCIMILCFLFGIGKLIFGFYIAATIYLSIALVLAIVISYLLKKNH